MSAPPINPVCEDCEDEIEGTPCNLVEALETFDAMLCDSCFDNRCEAAWDRHQESLMSEPPMSLDEQHRRAWQQHRELHR